MTTLKTGLSLSAMAVAAVLFAAPLLAAQQGAASKSPSVQASCKDEAKKAGIKDKTAHKKFMQECKARHAAGQTQHGQPPHEGGDRPIQD